jgi:prepilin-type N-terminal cleavage/methylation domain-containing protein
VLKTVHKLNLPERPPTKVAGLSLIELLIVIAVLAVLATLLIPYISPMQRNTQEIVARQQQAALQVALGNWISAASSQPGGLAGARSAYGGAGSKLTLLQNYLQPATYAALTESGNSVTSAALSGAGARLQFSDWGIGGTPTVNWINTP